jgi:KaiC/GvpD/RAD55 family RecA-like ATPase
MTSGTAFDEVLRPSALDPGTAVLVTGPALSGKRELLLSLLAADENHGAVFVTTRRNAASTVRDFADRGLPEDRLSVVDCVSRQGSLDRVRDAAGRRYVADPGDLTGLGIAVTEFLREHRRDGGTPWLGCHSLSTMVMYTDVRTVFRFLHVTIGRVRTADGVALVALDEATVSAADLAILSQPFDARLDVRERDGRDEVRARGADLAPREWTPIRTTPEF